jgi:hypothetical protein
MLLRIKNLITNYKTTIFITAEIFWILIFLLEKMGSENTTEIAQFVYVNF